MKLLFPVDNSECSHKTLEWAAQYFKSPEHEYHLLFVLPLIPDVPITEMDVDEAENVLNAAEGGLVRAGIQNIYTQVQKGSPVEQICAYSDLIQSDLVIIGSHGRTGISKLLMGSTSIAVMEHCKQPVIIYRNVDRTKKPKQV